MAITVDQFASAETAGASSLTWSHTCNNAQLLIVTVVYSSFRPGGIASVTYNGESLGLISNTAINGSFINMESQQYMLVNPPPGTYDVAVTANYSVGIMGISVTLMNTNGGIYNDTVQTDSEFATANDPHSGAYQYAALKDQLLFATISSNGGAVPTTISGQTILASSVIGSSYGTFILVEPILADGVSTYQFSGLSGSGFMTNGFVLDYVAPPAHGAMMLLGVG